MSSVEPSRWTTAVWPAGALLAGLAGWWLLAGPGGVPAFLLPTPTAVARRLAGNPGLYLEGALATLLKVLLGGAVGIAAGFILGVAVFYRPLVRRSVYPYLVTIRVLPTIAIAPLLLIYVGVGTVTAVVFVALLVFFPMVVNTVAGLERAPERDLDLLRSVAADGLLASLRVRLPYALPDVFAGLKQAVTLSVVGAVVAEWVVSARGLGALILLASENVQPAVMVAALVVLVVLGLALYGSVVLVQRRIPWLGELG